MSKNEIEKIMNRTMYLIIERIIRIRNEKDLLTNIRDYTDKIMETYYKRFEYAENKKHITEKLKAKKLPKISKNGKTIKTKPKNINPIDLTTVRPNKNNINEIHKCNFCGLCNIDKEKIKNHISEVHYREKEQESIEFNESELDIKVKGTIKPLKHTGNISMKDLKEHLTVKQLRNIKDNRIKTLKQLNGKREKIVFPVQLQTLDKSQFEKYVDNIQFNTAIYYITSQIRTKEGNIVYRIFHTENR